MKLFGLLSIKLYHEIHGQGEPLVLLHGGLMTIGEMSTLLEPLAKTRKVIAVELQGHGRTADTEVRRLVVISNPYARTGWYPEAQKGMAEVSAAMAKTVMQTPTGNSRNPGRSRTASRSSSTRWAR